VDGLPGGAVGRTGKGGGGGGKILCVGGGGVIPGVGSPPSFQSLLRNREEQVADSSPGPLQGPLY